MMRRKITAWLLAGAMILAGSMQGAYTVSAKETTGITKTAPSTSGEEEKEVHVEGLTINGEKTIYLRSANGKMQYVQTDLTVTYSPENAAEKEKKIKQWKSSNPDVAWVDINGKLEARSAGQTTITATAANGVAGTISIQVIYDGKIYTSNNKELYYNKGALLTNQFYVTEGQTVYLGSDGTKVTGWQNLNGKRYYFDGNGVMSTGWKTISGQKFYFTAEGAMLTGIQKIDGKTYCFNENGVVLTGWRTVNGKQYCFNEDGGMLTVGWLTSNGKKEVLF